MTAGKITVLVIVVLTTIFGIGLWWANTYAYYVALDEVEINLQRPDGSFIALDVTDATGIDAETSPLRYRACFTHTASDTSAAMFYDDPTPLTTPSWFDCFDAAAIGAALEAGEATAVLGQRNVVRGVDRVVALFPDGRGYAWNQLNGTLE